MRKMFSKFPVVLSIILLISAPALAQDAWPGKPIKWIVPYAAGGFADIRARKLAVDLARNLGQPVYVENRAGAGGVIGTDAVAKAAPDGYTIGMGNLAALSVNVSLMKKLPYDPLKDVQPVILVERSALIFTAGPGLPVNSVKDVISYAKTNPGKLGFGSSGVGGAHHLSGEMLKLRTGIDIVHIPYKGGAAAIGDLISGQVQLMFESTNSIAPHVMAGRVRALAVTGERRALSLPQVPTLMEAGVPGYEVNAWSGIITTAGVPRAVLDKLNAAVNRAIVEPKTKELLFTLGSEGGGGTPEEFAALIRRDSAKWAEVIKRSGAKID
jgi:tripartite-type tricarboxylate transporter receptor subunit TctC